MEKRFDKTKTKSEGYMEIFYLGNFTKVNIDHNINSMKAFQGFCACNELPSSRFAKLQGGYYILNRKLQWEFLGRALDSLPFRIVYEKLKSLRTVEDSEGVLHYIKKEN